MIVAWWDLCGINYHYQPPFVYGLIFIHGCLCLHFWLENKILEEAIEVSKCFAGDNFFSWFGHFCFSLDRQLVTFVCLFSTVRFQMSLQIACLIGYKITLVAIVWFSSLCVFKCLFKSSAREDAKSHWLHLFNLKLSNVSVNCLPTKMHI